MTISARRAASLGLWVPLSAIMSAVLGLWPEPEEEDAGLPPVYGGSGSARWSRRRTWPAIEWRTRTVARPLERARRHDDTDPDSVRRAWDEIDALRSRPQSPPGELSLPPSEPPVLSLVVASTPGTVSFSAPQPPDTWPDTRVSDDDALIALMVAELA